jgi:two-component system chemotaxis response regulator CheB
LFVKPGEVRLVRGPKENNFRPAVDPLFRSAAQAYGERVVGVILSGGLDDGTHGILHIKRRGGIAIAQSPDDAAEPSMPRSAIDRVGVDYVLPAAEIGAMLNSLVMPVAESRSPVGLDVPDVAEGLISALRLGDQVVPTSPFVCPNFSGALWEQRNGDLLHYRCHVGHGFTADTLSHLQDEPVEQALWTAIRTLEEQAKLQVRLADQSLTNQTFSIRERFLARAADCRHIANLLRSLVVGGDQEVLSDTTTDSIAAEYKAGD